MVQIRLEPWESSDPALSNSSIQGSYGNGFPGEIIEITDPKLFDAQNPLIAFSTSPLATTKAAATWIAKDLKTNNKVIQAAILTTLGWNNQPITLSENDGSEQVFKDHKIFISSDGRTIVANWTSFFPNLVNSIACCSISTNGGITWSKPAKLSKIKEALSEEQQQTSLEE